MCVCIIWWEEWARAWLSLFRTRFLVAVPCSRIFTQFCVIYSLFIVCHKKKSLATVKSFHLCADRLSENQQRHRTVSRRNNTDLLHQVRHVISFTHQTQSSSFRLLLADEKSKGHWHKCPTACSQSQRFDARPMWYTSHERLKCIFIILFVVIHSFRGFPAPSIFAISCSIWISCSVFHYHRNRPRLYFATSIYIPLKMRNDYSSLAFAASLLLDFFDEFF